MSYTTQCLKIIKQNAALHSLRSKVTSPTDPILLTAMCSGLFEILVNFNRMTFYFLFLFATFSFQVSLSNLRSDEQKTILRLRFAVSKMPCPGQLRQNTRLSTSLAKCHVSKCTPKFTTSKIL